MKSVLSAVLLLLAAPALAQPAADSRLTKLLDDNGLAYEVDEAGDLRLNMGLQAGRTQKASIESQPYAVAGAEFREIWSVGWASDQPPQWETVMRMLEDSHDAPAGGWTMHAGEQQFVLVYKVKLPADASYQHLLAALYAASFAADRLELAMSGKDEF